MDQTLDLSFFDTAANNDFFDNGIGKTLEGSNEIDTSNPTTVDTTAADTSASDVSIEDAFSDTTDYINIPPIPEDSNKKPKFSVETKKLNFDEITPTKEAKDYLSDEDTTYLENTDDKFGIYSSIDYGEEIIKNIKDGRYNAEEAGDILNERLKELERESDAISEVDPVAGSVLSNAVDNIRTKGFEAIGDMSKRKTATPLERSSSSTSSTSTSKTSEKLPPSVRPLDDIFGDDETEKVVVDDSAVQDIYDKYNASLQDAIKNGFAPDLARQAYQALKEIGAPAEDIEKMYEQIVINQKEYGSSGSTISFGNATTTKENLEEMKKKGLPTKQEFFETANKKLAELDSTDSKKKVENASGFIGRALSKGLVAAIKEGDVKKIGDALSDWKDVTKEKRQAVVDNLAEGNIIGALKASRGTNVFNMILGLVASGEITGNSDLIPEDFMKSTPSKDTSSNEDLNVMQTDAEAPKKSDYTGYNEGLQRSAYSDETKKKFKANVMRLYGKPLRERIKSYD